MKCFLAAHGTGKTTLINEIKRKKVPIFVTEGFARPIKKVFSEFIPKEDRVDYFHIEQALNFELMLTTQRSYYDQNVLSTRSLFDSLIFGRILGWSSSEQEGRVKEELRAERIKAFFYLPIEFPIEDDGVRYDADLQRLYDKEIHSIVEEYNLHDRLHIIEGSIEERVSQLIPLLND